MTEVVEPKKRRRLSVLVVTGVLAFVAALLAGGVVSLQHYQPLIRGETALFPMGKEVPSDDPSDERPIIKVTYIDGRTIRFGFSIKNNGRWGVTVSRIGEQDPGSGGLVTHLAYHLASETFIRDLGPFHPFALQPGQQQSILVSGLFANCENYVFDSSSVFESIRVQYKTLDIIHTTDIPLEDLIAVVSPSDANCPRPRSSA